MGYASYLEDIRNRLDTALHELRVAPAAGAAVNHRRTQELLEACQKAIDQLDEWREMVDDPRFDLAYEVAQLDREKEELRAEIQDLNLPRARLHQHAANLEAERKQAKLELKRLQAEIRQRDAEYEALLRANPEAAYERHWPGPRDARA